MSSSSIIDLTIGLGWNVVLLLALVSIYILFRSSIKHVVANIRVLVTGFLFGLFAIIAMTIPIATAPGVLLDGRAIMLAIAGAFDNWQVAGVAAALAVPYRLWLGGAGAIPGIGTVVTCAILGSLFFQWRKGHIALYTVRDLFLLGAAVAVQWLVWTLFLPGTLPSTIFEAIVLPVIFLFPLGTLLAGSLLVRDQRRVETEEALASERNVLRTLIDSIPDYIFVKDTHSSFVMANNATVAETTFPGFEQLVGKTDFDLFPAEIAQQFYEDEQQIIRTGRALISKEEASFDLRTGQLRWFSSTKVPLRDSGGHITGILGISRNVTERKAQEAALHDSEKEFRALLEFAPEAMVIVNQQGSIELVNSQTEKLFGYTRGELIGQTIDMLIPEPYHSRHAAHRDGYSADPHVRDMGIGLELYALRKGGSAFPVEVSLSPIETAHGVLIASAVRDITERKQAEEQMTAERALLRTLIDALPDYIFVKDRSGHFVLSNLALALAVHIPNPDGLVGKTATDVFPAELAVQFDADDQAVMRSGNPLINQERLSLNTAGKPILVLTTKVPLRNPNGDVTGLVGISRDITANKRAEQQERELAQERERVKVLADFVQNVSHDFRTPLTIIRTSLDLLRRTTDPERQEQRMTTVEQQVTRLTEFFEQILVMTHLDAGVTLNRQPFDMTQIVLDATSTLQALVYERGIALHTEGMGDPPLVRVDYGELRQAVREIVKNAIWFTPRDGAVTIRASASNDQAVIEVRDTGSGITPNDLPHIFERLYRADKARSNETGGFGLGLCIAQRIMELHDGTIEVESTVGVGTTVRLVLPTEIQHSR